MTSISRDCFRVGVVGLGRLWEARYRPALERLSTLFQVTAVFDQVPVRAAREAKRLRCDASPGLTALVERDDVDVLFLLSPQWHGLHALSLAADLAKPVFCALPIAGEPDLDLDRLDRRITGSGMIFVPEFARRFYPVTLRLRELLATTLGPSRLILGQARLSGYDRYGVPGPSNQIAPAPLLIDPGTYLFDWCRFVRGADPTAIRGDGGHVVPSPSGEDHDYENLTLDFADGAKAQFGMTRFHRSAWGEATRFLPDPGVQVYAESGAAWLEFPDKIYWSDREGLHEERFPPEPSIGDVLCEQLHRTLSAAPSLSPGWPDALAAARAVRAIQADRCAALKSRS